MHVARALVPDTNPVTQQPEAAPGTSRRRVWWERLLLPPGAEVYECAATAQQRERLRHARLTAVIVTCSTLAPLLLTQQAAVDPHTAGAVMGMLLVGICALAFNRFGYQRTASILTILGADTLIEGAIVTGAMPNGLSTAWLQSFDLFVLLLIVAAMLLPPVAVWPIAAAHISLILLDYLLLPHAPDLVTLTRAWNGGSVAVARPVMVQVVAAALCYITMCSVLEAIRRADRAEEVARLEHAVAADRQEVEAGVRDILDTLIQVANGHRHVRVRTTTHQGLWQVGAAINNQLNRMQKADRERYQLQRTEDEIHRLAAALDDARQGRRPLWPAPSGTVVDMLLERLRTPMVNPTSGPLANAGSVLPPGDRAAHWPTNS